MIPIQRFNDLIYKKPVDRPADEIEDLIGLDSEAYIDGQPFMICMSDGFDFQPQAVPHVFFVKYPNRHCVTYNLKYDSGAVLYNMPNDLKKELWTYGKCKWDGVTVTWIPKKLLRFTYDKQSFYIWDILQFYKSSLKKAAKTYLPNVKGKIHVETKRFTRAYVKKNYTSLREYCVHDAVLAAELGKFFLSKLKQFGIKCTALYSCASLSYRYFTDMGANIHVWRYWKYYKESIKFALESYEGGKFEMTSRGYFPSTVEYDITSAYPWEIKNLVDISNATVVRSSRFVPEATYAFLRCHIDNTKAKHIPCGLMRGPVAIYPAGTFYKTITLREYFYLKSIKVPVEILSGYWLVIRGKKHYPYAHIIDQLFELKNKYKNKDLMLFNLSKVMMNSYYGKFVQALETPPDRDTGLTTFKAGLAFNPFYASVITANTRIMVTKVQNAPKAGCIAVHTDSVILTGSFPGGKEPSGDLGTFERKHEGACLMIACGQYDIEDKSAFKGFKPVAKDSWRKILQSRPRSSIIPYPQLRSESWVEAVSKGHYDSVNLFDTVTKRIDLNADRKRVWPEHLTAKKLLDNQYSSEHMIVCDAQPPDEWK